MHTIFFLNKPFYCTSIYIHTKDVIAKNFSFRRLHRIIIHNNDHVIILIQRVQSRTNHFLHNPLFLDVFSRGITTFYAHNFFLIIIFSPVFYSLVVQLILYFYYSPRRKTAFGFFFFVFSYTYDNIRIPHCSLFSQNGLFFI